MSDTVTLDPGSGGATIATDDLGATGHVQWVKLRDGTDNGTQTIASGGGTETAALRVTVASDSTGVLSVDDNGGSITVDGTVTATGPLTDTQLRATAVPVSGPLTDTQLRATAVPVSGTVTANAGSGPWPVTDNGGSLTVDNGGTFAVQDSQVITDDAAFTVATSKVQPVGFLADQVSTDSVDEGDIGAARMTLDRKQIVTMAPSVDTEGATPIVNIDMDESEDAVKASAGKLLGWFIYNDGASEAYVKFYNDTVANVVVGTTAPFMTIPIPAGSASNINWGAIGGIPFSLAITVAATTGAATADTGAPATNQVVGTILFV